MKTTACLIFLFGISTSTFAQNHRKYFEQGDCKTRGLEEEGTIINGKREGYWKFYYWCLIAQDVREEGMYANDKKTGIWKSHSPHGYMYMETPFVDGKENGECIQYHQGGKIASKVTYRNGQMVGTRTSFFEHGSIEKIENFETGEIKEHYENGQLKQSGFYDANKWLTREGEWKTYHRNGKLKTIGSFSNNQQTGIWKEYSDNGNIKSKGEMKSFLRTGKWECFDKNGRLNAVGLYKNDGYPAPGTWVTYDERQQRDSTNCPEPTQDNITRMMVHISQGSLSEHDEMNYSFEEILWKISCADPDKDTEDDARPKIQKMWNKYGREMKVTNVFGMADGKNFLKYLAEKMILQDVLSKYKLEINFIDPADGKTVLDFVKQMQQVFSSPELESLREYLKDLHDYLKKYGAKEAVNLQ